DNRLPTLPADVDAAATERRTAESELGHLHCGLPDAPLVEIRHPSPPSIDAIAPTSPISSAGRKAIHRRLAPGRTSWLTLGSRALTFRAMFSPVNHSERRRRRDRGGVRVSSAIRAAGQQPSFTKPR